MSAPRSLLPDCGGTIRQLAISVVPQCFADHDIGRALLRALGSFVATLPEALDLAILVSPQTRPELGRWLDKTGPRCRIEPVPADFHANDRTIELWTQDSFLVTGAGNAYLKPASENQTAHADWLARAFGNTLDAQPFRLTGGNLLVGPDFILIGCESLPADPRLRADMIAVLERLDPRPVFEVGYRLGEGRFDAVSGPGGRGTDLYRMRQYGGHIDRTIAVTGLRENGRPLLIVARAVCASAAAAAEIRPVADRLDRTARALSDLGFAVRRNDVPFVPALGNVQLRPRLYNNVLVENQIRPGHLRPLVWVPQFADEEAELEAFDAANLALWHDLGFDAVPAPGWSKLAVQMGALRCATKVLLREEWLPAGACVVSSLTS